MPAALYDYSRKKGFSPLKLGDGFITPTDRQTQDYLLCKTCEDLLSSKGETWVIPQLATVEGIFPLYELLTRVAPVWTGDEGESLYSADPNPDVRVNMLVHFAMGIFWKASVHSWSSSKIGPRIDFGPYSESIRKWLIDSDAPAPDNVYLGISLSEPSRAQIAMSDPYEGPREGWSRRYFLYIYGVLFVLNIGKPVPQDFAIIDVFRNSYLPILVSRDLTDKMEGVFASATKKARKTQAFLDMKERWDQAKR